MPLLCGIAAAGLRQLPSRGTKGLIILILGGALQMAGLVERRCAAGLVDCQSTKRQAVF